MPKVMLPLPCPDRRRNQKLGSPKEVRIYSILGCFSSYTVCLFIILFIFEINKIVSLTLLLGWSAVVQSQLTATYSSPIQAILLPYPPE